MWINKKSIMRRRIRKIKTVREKLTVTNESNVTVRKDKPKLSKVKVSPSQAPTIEKRNMSPVNKPWDRSKVKFTKVNPIWSGETVYIVGGGPSLSNFNWDALRTRKVIAINKAFLNVPFASVMYWTDSRVYQWHKKDIENFSGLKYTIRPHSSYREDVLILRKGNRHGLETTSDRLAHGDNSGYAAINLAYHLGAKKIVLLGYDMGNNGTKSHYHEGYPVTATSQKTYNDRFIPGFSTIAGELKRKGIKVFNASPQSRLNAFPKITLQESLRIK